MLNHCILHAVSRDEAPSILVRLFEYRCSVHLSHICVHDCSFSSNLRSSILAEFYGHVLRLLLHREASPIIADAYELYANASERDHLLSDLFGKEVTLFQTPSTSDNKGKHASRGLKAVLEGVDFERRKRTLIALKDNLMSV
jgi:pumilio family protein 6